MKLNGKLYILDAKYYRYGVTGEAGDLPNTSSIQKKITYAEHAASHCTEDFGGTKDDIYNAFVMPFNSLESTGGKADYVLKFVAVAKSGWDDEQTGGDEKYRYILGLLLDTRHLVTTFARHNLEEIEKLADKIETSVEEYRRLIRAGMAE